MARRRRRALRVRRLPTSDEDDGGEEERGDDDRDGADDDDDHLVAREDGVARGDGQRPVEGERRVDDEREAGRRAQSARVAHAHHEPEVTSGGGAQVALHAHAAGARVDGEQAAAVVARHRVRQPPEGAAIGVACDDGNERVSDGRGGRHGERLVGGQRVGDHRRVVVHVGHVDDDSRRRAESRR